MDLSGLCARASTISQRLSAFWDLTELRLQYTGATWNGDMKFLKADNSQIQKAIGEIPQYDIRKVLKYID